ncbi:MAG TPA: hypothetical protein V6D48_15240 [Oculatellaceae cyanobacterium]
MVDGTAEDACSEDIAALVAELAIEQPSITIKAASGKLLTGLNIFTPLFHQGFHLTS